MYKHDVDCITGGGGGELRSGVGPAGARVQSHAMVAVTPPGDDWRGLALAITLIPVTQLEQKRFQTRCRT